MKFKVGDMVKIIKDHHNDEFCTFLAGTIGVIARIHPMNNNSYQVSPLDDSKYWRYSEDMLELYQQTKSTQADKIRAMSDQELAEFINMVAKDSMDTIAANGTKDYSEIWEDYEPTLQWLQEEIE